MKKIRVAILFGGKSAEHEVSKMSADSVIENIDREKFEVIPIEISKSGKFPLQKILSSDIVFPVLHGAGGEDGSIQGFCEVMQKPYVGAGIEASALALDKIASKQIWQNLKIPIPHFDYFSKIEWHKNPTTIMRKLVLPAFIKPANTGSSIGISKVKSRNKIQEAVEEALKYHDRIIVEEAIENLREFEIAVLGNDEIIVSTACEVIPEDSFYTYRAKYDPTSGTQFIIPARLPKQKINEIQDIATKAYKAINCQGMARVDFFLRNNKVILNEINTIPGFTKMSVYPMLMQAEGISYKDLITKLINLGLERS